jgi:hypothetical protein
MEKLHFTSQTTSHFESSPPNYQSLDSGPQNYQKVSKRQLLSKYAYNTLATCHFSIKK